MHVNLRFPTFFQPSASFQVEMYFIAVRAKGWPEGDIYGLSNVMLMLRINDTGGCNGNVRFGGTPDDTTNIFR